MTRQIFSSRMFKEGLRKNKITTVIFLAYILLVQVVIPLIQGLYGGEYGAESGPAVIMAPLFVIPYLWVPIQTLVLFYAFDKRGSSDFYQSLPYTRTCMFVSWMLSVLTVTVGGLLAGFAVGYLIRLPFPKEYFLNTAGLGTVLLMFLAAILFAEGCTLIAVSVTGTLLSNVACTLLLMFLPRLVMYAIRSMMLTNMPILVDDRFLQFFSIHYNLFVGLLPNLVRGNLSGLLSLQEMAEAGPFLYTFVLAVVYLLIALYLFNRRKSETAEHSASGKVVKGIVLTAIGFTISLIGTYVAADSAPVAIIFYIIAVLVFLAYELLTTRRWGNLLKALPLLILVLLLNLAVAGGVAAAKASILSKEYQPEKIQAVKLMEQAASPYDYLARINEQVEIEDPQVKEIVAHRFTKEVNLIKGTYHETQPTYEKIAMIRTNGKTDYYKLEFTEEELQLIGKKLETSEAFRETYMTLPEFRDDTFSLQLNDSYAMASNRGLSKEQAQAVLETLKGEIKQMGFEKWYAYVNTAGYVYSDEFPIAYIRYTEKSPEQLSVNIPLLHSYLPETWNAVINLWYENQDTAKLKELLTKAKYTYGMDIVVHIAKGNGQEAEVYLNSEDSDKEEMTSILLSAIEKAGSLDYSGFLLVNGWWSENYYTEQEESWLLPLPDHLTIENGTVVIIE